MEHSDSDEPPGRGAYVARAALDSVVLQQFADLLARRPPKRPPSDVPRPEIDEKLIPDEHGAYERRPHADVVREQLLPRRRRARDQ